jgi:PIN domain nuclease of toxin-antitoxin system
MDFRRGERRAEAGEKEKAKMKLVLDTHIILRAVLETLDEKRSLLIQNRANESFVSAVTLWEITKLVEHGKLAPSEPLRALLDRITKHPGYRIVSYSTDLMCELREIAPKMHRDPADQLIVATARMLGAVLLTDDAQIRASKLVRTL